VPQAEPSTRRLGAEDVVDIDADRLGAASCKKERAVLLDADLVDFAVSDR
jgi:hypothetical protein